MRMAAVRHRGAGTHVVVCLSHLAADGGGVGAMMRELGERDPATNRARDPEAPTGPLELAAWQAAESGRRASSGSLRHWERVLRTVPARRFVAEAAGAAGVVDPAGTADAAGAAGVSDPADGAGVAEAAGAGTASVAGAAGAADSADGPRTDDAGDRYRSATFESPALAVAARALAAEYNRTPAAVVLAAYARVLTRLGASEPVVVQGVVDNRFRPGLTRVSHPLCQNGILVLEVGDAPFAELVGRAQRASLQASKYAYFDPAEHRALLAGIGDERGEPVDVGILFNVRGDAATRPGSELAGPRPTPEELRAARAGSVLRWGPP